MDLLSPLGLALGALAAPLVALYFLRIRRRRVRVSSLLAWHALKQQDRLASPFQRFRRNLLLFLQLLLLAALTFAAARPFLASELAPWRSIVLVVDTSASMGATDAEPTRLAEAVRRGRALLDRLGPTDEAMLVVAGPRTEVVVPFTRDEDRVSAALDALEPAAAEGALREGLQLAVSLAASRPDVEVVVLSDGGPNELASVSTGGVPVRHERVGSSGENTGIVALELRRNPVHDLQRQLFVTVRTFGREPVDASVELGVDGALVGLRAVRLHPETPVSLVFDLSGSTEGLLEVRVDAPGDRLPVDDLAWAVLEPVAPRRVLLVGADALTARALLSDPRATVTRVGPAEVTPELLAAHDAAIFAAAVPDGLDGYDYAVLGPSHGGPVRFGDRVAAPTVTDWQRTHPVLRFVDLEAVAIAEAHTVLDAGGLVPIVRGEAGPLLLAGERHGGRVVQLAFDPLRSDLPLRVAWPVLLLDVVGWLTEDVPQPSVAPARSTPNLLSESESRIAPRSLAFEVGEGVRSASMAVGRRELWRELLLVGFALLVLEWVVWSRRRAA